ncbi:MAG: tetratricopeptide repeat protein [Desulfuromonadales bacterium]|nr:tetratricopeptide repeat protein [Desulfuromonadales bacterium]
MVVSICSNPLRRWRLLVTAALLLLLAACSFSVTTKEEHSAQLQMHLAAGDLAWQGRDYTAAGNAYGAARLLVPADPALDFRLGMVQEHLGNYAVAADFYRTALKEKNFADELRHQLTYRLALLEAFRLQGGEQVPVLLSMLPPTSAYAADLQAVLALLAGDGRKALAALNTARSLPLTQEMSSIILYHAARAYYLTGEVDLALKSLFEAINLAGYAPVTKDISEFREFLIKQPRS